MRDDVTPTIDVGLLQALKSGSVTVVAAVERFTKDSVVHADGTESHPDAVVLADRLPARTRAARRRPRRPRGHRSPARQRAGQLAAHPGLFFLGYSNPLTGNLRQVGLDATKIAKVVAAAERSRVSA